MRPAVLGLTLLLGLPGCLGLADPEAPGPPGPPEEPAAPSAGLLSGSDCRGVKTSASFRGLAPAGSAPPGWEPGPAVENKLYYLVAECRRAATAGFERPLLFVVESHQRFRAPESCLGGSPGLPYMVSAVWVSDPGVAEAWASRYGLPAAPAHVERSEGTGSGLPGTTWSWSVASGPPSRVEAFDAGTQPTQLHGGGRLFWAHPGGGIARSDLQWSLQTHHDRNPVQVGELHAPTLWSQGLTTRYAGLGDRFEASQLEASHQAFEDLGCREPVS
jgi:hypothetical protein